MQHCPVRLYRKLACRDRLTDRAIGREPATEPGKPARCTAKKERARARAGETGEVHGEGRESQGASRGNLGEVHGEKRED